jgi:BlaI family transcriptional regulator, penicillinase repressor
MSVRKHKGDLGQLGRRERQIMNVIVRHGRVTAAEVREELPDPPSYSAVRGMLRLLEDKGYVRHEWDGPRYVYVPSADPERIRHSAVQHLLHTFFSNSMESAVAAMLGAKENLSDEELKRMAKLIDDARRQRRRS